MSAQIVIFDKVIDLGEEINFNFQVGDIAEISLSKSTYTSTFKIPRTSELEELFMGLAIPSDRSRLPYNINDVILMDDYVPLMKGVLVFMRTDNLYFNVTSISGTYDFFTEIGDTKYSDIDISEIVHEKTLDVVAGNINGLILHPYGGHFTYGFANFGGLTHYTVNDDPDTIRVNIDTLCPVVTAKYLWDKIFETFPRFSFSGDFYSLQDFERLWVVFPYGSLLETGQSVDKVAAGKQSFAFTNPNFPIETSILVPGDISVDATGHVYTAITSGWTKITVRSFRASFTDDPPPPDIPLNIGYLGFALNGAPFHFLQVKNTLVETESYAAEYDIFLNSGDYFTMSVLVDTYFDNGFIYDLDVVFSRTELVNDELVFGLTLKSFIKEIMWRYGLLAFVENDHIDFVMMKDVINSGDVVNWSEKYIRRTEEEYTLDYNQNNWLRHKYDEEGVTYFDKNIQVDNKNINPSKNLIQSNFFAPLENKSPYRTNDTSVIQAVTFPVFDEDKVQNRNFFARVRMENIPYRIGSYTMGGSVNVTPSPGIQLTTHIIDFDNLPFSENTYYNALTKILDLTRVHRIELLLTPIDINQLSLKKLYYFEQEGSYYMLNKLQYKKGDPAKGEFIKISEQITGIWMPIDPYCVSVDGVNTGDQGYENLRDQLSGDIKPNIPSDPNYVAPSPNPACPEEETFPLFQTVSKSQYYPFQVGSGGNTIKIIVRRPDGSLGVYEGSSSSKVVDLSIGPPSIIPSGIYTGGPIGYADSITLLRAVSASVVSVDISNYPNMNTIDLTSNPMYSIPDLSGHPITWLSLAGTQITAFDTAQVPGVIVLFIDNTSINTINTSVIPNVVSLNVSSTNINTLDITPNNSLTELRCAGLSFTNDGADTALIDAIINKMDQNIISGGLLAYGVDNFTGVQPSSAATTAYNSLLSKGCVITGRQPL